LDEGTHRENVQASQVLGHYHVPRPTAQKLTLEQLAYVYSELATGVRGTKARLAREFGVTKAYITLLAKGKRRQYDAPIQVSLEQAG
jgi:hypothetical protein